MNNKLVSYIKINKNDINQRIDNFLFKKIKKISKKLIYKKIRKGEFRINKKRKKPKYKLKKNDIIRIPPIIYYKNNKNIKNKKLKININLMNKILYEDNYILIINKPQGIAVHNGSGISNGIIEILRKKYFKNKYLELVHRIDKNTSGVLILAKKKKILCILHKKFLQNKIKKKYLAIVKGFWDSKIKIISNKIYKIKGKNKKIIINKNGKLSITKFKIKQFSNSKTLLSIQPITGRTHQIRVQTSYLGKPIIFDERYGKKIKKKNILLHAESIFLKHPITKKKMLILAPLNKKFKKYLNYF
ncbi:RluA family pseudouridine synthase [Buchnera aphidicola]|uniref:RluA family pseudouridine synthase n=1 Tax=Buchnera aphidicola TaxID=9 RepID=UPI0031B824C7